MVAIVITAAVYGVVAAIVKMDDVGLSLTQRKSRFGQWIGRGLVAGMPKLLTALSAIGTVAMLWVGGHILLVGSDELGWHPPYGVVHHLEGYVADVAGCRWCARVAGQYRGVRRGRVGRRGFGRRDSEDVAVRPSQINTPPMRDDGAGQGCG